MPWCDMRPCIGQVGLHAGKSFLVWTVLLALACLVVLVGLVGFGLLRAVIRCLHKDDDDEEVGPFHTVEGRLFAPPRLDRTESAKPTVQSRSAHLRFLLSTLVLIVLLLFFLFWTYTVLYYAFVFLRD